VSAIRRRPLDLEVALQAARASAVKIVDFQMPVTAVPAAGAPPEGLVAFYWHFIKQTKGWYAAMFAASLAVALLDTVVPLFIGRLVSLMETTDRAAALAAAMPMLVGMIVLILVVRPLAILADVSIRHNALVPGATRSSLITRSTPNSTCAGSKYPANEKLWRLSSQPWLPRPRSSLLRISCMTLSSMTLGDHHGIYLADRKAQHLDHIHQFY
jgi:hypothetical protein